MTFLASEVTVRSNGENAKTAPISMLARTGDAIEHWYWGRVVHDLEGMKLSKSRLPIDWNHSDELIGTLTKFDTSSGDLVVSGFLKTNGNRTPDHAAIVMSDSQGDDAIPYEASINFGGNGVLVEDVPTGKTVTVNGREFTGPIAVIRQWPLRGVAITPYGADENTKTTLSNVGEKIVVYKKKKEVNEMSEAVPAEAEKAVEATPETPTTEAEKAVEVETPEAKPAAPPAEAVDQPKPHERFTAVGGDKGATAFLKGVPFDEFVLSLVKERDEAIERLTREIAELKSRTSDALGNPAAGVSVSEPRAASVDPKMVKATGSESLARFASGIKFAK